MKRHKCANNISAVDVNVKQICTVKKGSTMKFEYFFKLANITTQSTGKDLTLLFGMFYHPRAHARMQRIQRC